LLASCKGSNGDFDATGTFESTEVIVSSEVTGKILKFSCNEGEKVDENAIVGKIDSTQFELKRKQLEARLRSIRSKYQDVNKQTAPLLERIGTAKTEKKRAENLINANAGNQKQLDDIKAELAVLERQLIAQKDNLESGNNSVQAESASIAAQIEELNDQIERCKIKSPISGTILAKYSEKGELASTGKPLFRVADLEKMYLRAYITVSQLAEIKLGSELDVIADYGKGNEKHYKGIVTWISDKSEFTPKSIQTKDERGNLVYAVKISVDNDGYLKICMYGRVKFGK
jgi:HlyD family secretion protein